MSGRRVLQSLTRRVNSLAVQQLASPPLLAADVPHGPRGLDYDNTVREPNLTAADLTWLARDAAVLKLFPHQNDALRFLEVLVRALSTSTSSSPDHSEILSRANVPLMIRALSTLPVDHREHRSVKEVLRRINEWLLPRLSQKPLFLGEQELMHIMKSIPSLSMDGTKVPELLVHAFNIVVKKMDTFSPTSTMSVLQTLMSQLPRRDASHCLPLLDVAELDRQLAFVLRQKNALRLICPMVLTGLARFLEAGLPLSPNFDTGLKAYMSYCVGNGKSAPKEALRVLYAICRVRLLQKRDVYGDEFHKLVSLVLNDVNCLDGKEISMLLHVLSFNQSLLPAQGKEGEEQQQLSSSSSEGLRSYARTSSSSSSSSTSVPVVPPTLLRELTVQLEPQISTLSLRGLLTLSRSLTLMPLGAVDTGTSEAIAARCADFVLGREHAGHPMDAHERTTLLSSGNSFYRASAVSRQCAMDMVRYILNRHEGELHGGHISILWGSLGWAFGSQAPQPQLQQEEPLNAPASPLLNSVTHEIDAAVLDVLLQRSVTVPIVYAHSYSVMLRAFAALEMDYEEVRLIVRRILTLKAERTRTGMEEEPFAMSPMLCGRVVQALERLRSKDVTVLRYLETQLRVTYGETLPEDIQKSLTVLAGLGHA